MSQKTGAPRVGIPEAARVESASRRLNASVHAATRTDAQPATVPAQLTARHAGELREASAIPLDVIAERGYRTISDPAELIRLGFADYQARTPGFLIPLHGTDGSNGRFAFKPDQPRVREGKPLKYEYPAGNSHMLDVPPRCLEALSDPSVPLFLAEGAKKSDALASLGYCTINIWGTSAWYRNPQHGGFATIEPLPDWDVIKPTLDGRACYLVYDSDAWSNPNVARELRRLANWLARQGALVYVVHLPDEPDGSKNGADDYIARHGSDAFRDRIANAEPWGSAAMVKKLQGELQTLQQQHSAQAEVMRNPALRPTEKLVAVAVVNEAGWRVSVGSETPFAVSTHRLAIATGLTRQTVGRAIDVLAADGGIFEKQITREFVDGVGWRSAVKLSPRHDGGVVGLLKAAARVTPERAAWGGRRPHCPDHPDADLIERRALVCAECGQVVHEATHRFLKLQGRTSETGAPVEAGPGLKLQDATPKYEQGEGGSAECLQSQVVTSAADEAVHIWPGCTRTGRWRLLGGVELCDACYRRDGTPRPPPGQARSSNWRAA